ncbi:hypothetical protein JW859_00360 [bacterium]|nr:hypothetical protein [bacterium]
MRYLTLFLILVCSLLAIAAQAQTEPILLYTALEQRGDADWSPGGTQIALASTKGEQFGLWVMSVDPARIETERGALKRKM